MLLCSVYLLWVQAHAIFEHFLGQECEQWEAPAYG